MTRAGRALWARNRAGVAGSILLHLGAALLWLWWALHHPVPRQAPLKAMNVELVAAPVVMQPTVPQRAGGGVVLPRARVRTAPRVTGVTPNAVKQPPDEMEARIAGLARLTAPASALPAPDNDGPASGNGSGGGYALADFVRAQILRRWWPDLSTASLRGMPVAITLSMTRTGVISNVRIVDQTRLANDKLFRGMAFSARNAALNASPIALPPGHYDAIMEIAITLDPKSVLH